VDALARRLASTGLPHAVLVDLARESIASFRDGDDDASLLARATASAVAFERRLLQPVVNATGVLLHTNLGRAPLTIEGPARYVNLEFDLGEGGRGERSSHAAALIAKACGAEAALVVNNGAAAVLLVLAVLADSQDVIISRGELIEIGGGFRIPEILTSSGARLTEVGTTNRTRLADYAAAVARPGAENAIILKVHTSNFAITGFTEAAPVAELTDLGLPVVVDLGSGLIDARCPWLADGPPEWLAGEPGVTQLLEDGAAIVTFSGDKLLGGPQAGIIAGRRDLVEQCTRHPLARALRPGGAILGALQDVALAYLRRDAGVTLPLWQMATVPVGELQRRAKALSVGEVVACDAVMGGGTLPSATIPSVGVAIEGDITAALRRASPPVIARVKADQTICDLRTVFEDQDVQLAKVLHG
jgi:L-seryl-tRNA(Ser) seleniumtransferase